MFDYWATRHIHSAFIDRGHTVCLKFSFGAGSLKLLLALVVVFIS